MNIKLLIEVRMEFDQKLRLIDMAHTIKVEVDTNKETKDYVSIGDMFNETLCFNIVCLTSHLCPSFVFRI